jgi:lincosamide nucleotidyltransferase
MNILLNRFNTIIEFNKNKEEVLAFLGLGSMHETNRLDQYSDIDFFLIVNNDINKKRYMEDISWLDVSSIAFSYIETRDGLKVIYEDGILLEFAVFTLDELKQIPFQEGTIYYKKDFINANDLKPQVSLPDIKKDVDKLISNCLSNLYVGMLRELRGEHVAAFLMIQVYATSNLLKILDSKQEDPFVVERRIERRLSLSFKDIYPGIEHNKAAVSAILNYLDIHEKKYTKLIQLIQAML